MMNSHTMNIFAVKMLAISYSSVFYVILAYIMSYAINRIVGDFDPEKADEKSTACITGEVILHGTVIAVSIFFARNIVEKIPFPLEGAFKIEGVAGSGFEYSRVKEAQNAFVFALVLMRWQYNFKDKLNYLYKRIVKKEKQIIAMNKQ